MVDMNPDTSTTDSSSFTDIPSFSLDSLPIDSSPMVSMETIGSTCNVYDETSLPSTPVVLGLDVSDSSTSPEIPVIPADHEVWLPSQAQAGVTQAACMPLFDFPLGYIKGKVNGMSLQFLIDSACSFATIDVSVWSKLPKKPELKPFSCPITTANQQFLNCHGYVEVTVQIEDVGPFSYELLVADIGEGEAIMGHNLMKLLKAQIDVGRDVISIVGKAYSYGPCLGRKVAMLRCNKMVTLRPLESKVVTVQVEGEWEKGDVGLVTPSYFLTPTSGDKGLTLNPGVVKPAKGRAQVLITNLSTEPKTLPKSYQMGTMETVESVVPFSECCPDPSPSKENVAKVMSAVSRGQVSQNGSLLDIPTPSSVGDGGGDSIAQGKMETIARGPMESIDSGKSVPEALPKVLAQGKEGQANKPEPPRAAKATAAESQGDTASSKFCAGDPLKDLPWDDFMTLLQRAEDVELPAHLHPLMDGLSPELDAIQRNQVRALLYEFQDRFTEPEGPLGQTGMVTHTIDTGDHPPVKQSVRRTPLASRLIQEEEIKKMLAQGVIEPSCSAWASPVVLVKKKDGTYRFCVDYRKLNELTKKDAYPLPRLDDSIEAMEGAEWFNTLDLHSGYWQVEMAEADKEKTAFVTRMGLYQFRVMPFGLTNAPATFERLMELVLQGLQWEQLQVYLDDIIVFGKSFLMALYHLALVFLRFRKANLKMKVKKCQLFQREVTFLGHIVSREGVKCDPEKIEAIVNWEHPQNLKDVRSFVGFASYYRRFVPHFSTLAEPLTSMSGKDELFEWTNSRELAFRSIKECLTTAPVLAYPRVTDQFILDTDASNVGIGAVLSQVQDGEERVIGYFSKTLAKPQRSYCTTYKELLAVVRACQHFKSYIWGQPVIVRTDHASLTWLRNFKEPEGMVARWIATLDSFNIAKIVHRPGAKHVNADALSRKMAGSPCTRMDCPCCRELRELKVEQAREKEACKGKSGTKKTQGNSENPKPQRVVRKRKKLVEMSVQTEPVGEFSVKAPCTETPTSQSVRQENALAENSPALAQAPPGENSERLPPEKPFKLPKPKVYLYPPDYLNRRRRRQKAKHPLPLTPGRGKQLPEQPSHSQAALSDPENVVVVNNVEMSVLENSDEKESSPENENVDLERVSQSLTPSHDLPQGTASAKVMQTRTSQMLEKIDDFMSKCDLGDIVAKQATDPDLVHLSALLKQYETRPAWKNVASGSAELKAYWTKWDEMKMKNGVLWRCTVEMFEGKMLKRYWRLVVPPVLRNELLKLVHDHKTSGHLGEAKTYARLKQFCYWPGCKADVKRWCKRCHQCALIKPGGEHKRAPLLQQLSGMPMERIAADIVGPLPETERGNRYLLVLQDYFSKWMEVYPLPQKTTMQVADKLLEMITRMGIPRQFHTDQGGEFTSDIIKNLCQLLEIDKTQTTPYLPSSDGMVERLNRTIQNMLRAYVSEYRDDWDEAIPFLCMAYRSTEHESTKCTPNLLMLGREVETPLSVQYLPPAEPPDVACEIEYVEWARDVMRRAHTLARQNLQKAATRQKRVYDQSASRRKFQIGEWIYLRDFVGGQAKLGLKWKGPFMIVKVRGEVTLAIQKNPLAKIKTVHVNHVKQCFGEHEESWEPPGNIDVPEDPEEIIENPGLAQLFVVPESPDEIQQVRIASSPLQSESEPETHRSVRENSQSPSGDQSAVVGSLSELHQVSIASNPVQSESSPETHRSVEENSQSSRGDQSVVSESQSLPQANVSEYEIETAQAESVCEPKPGQGDDSVLSKVIPGPKATTKQIVTRSGRVVVPPARFRDM